MIPLIGAEEAKRLGREAGLTDFFVNSNLVRAMIHSRAGTAGFYVLLNALFFEGKLNVRQRQLLVLRTAWRARSEYMFCRHIQVSLDLGMDQAEILGVRDPELCGRYSLLDLAVIRLADELHEDAAVTPATWATLEGAFDPEQMVELLLAAGTWRMAGTIFNNAELKLEDGPYSRWPEGREPDPVAPSKRASQGD